MGDVVRDLPAALATHGWRVTVLTPSYGKFHTLPDAKELAPVPVEFRGDTFTVRVFELPGATKSTRTILFEHELLAPTTPGRIYHDDGAARPYATDANKFSLFCAAAASWVDALPALPDAIHLHDWHSAYYLLQREFSSSAVRLKQIRTVFTIHNLAYQGQRPLRGDESSLEAWFPGMHYNLNTIADPRADDCINPMAFAIRRADRVNTVSPTYAKEIQRPSDSTRGFFGGEGLERDLIAAADDGRLSGILNGCDYSVSLGRRPGWQRLIIAARDTATALLLNDPDAAVHQLAIERLAALPKRRPLHVLTSIGRIVSQKMQLFLQPLTDGRSALEHLLEKLGHHGVLLLLGSGEAAYENQLEQIAVENSNLVYLRGYSEEFGDLLYYGGDLFLMPSSFEPCGISQMMAMRAGQPCIVHGVGGLQDTVDNDVTGFVFVGETPQEQAVAFVDTIERALRMRHDHPNRWQTMRKRAAAQRFDWVTSAQHYIEQLYDDDCS